MPLDFQFTNLLSATALKSVQWSEGPIILVIDGLDECGNETDRKVLMKALSKGFSDLPSFLRVVLVSRPEFDIEDTLTAHPAVYSYSLDIGSVTTREDISEFLRYRFSEIRETTKRPHLPPDWPGRDRISALMESAGGLFVWASTACLYIESYAPDYRLNELITHQSAVTTSGPFANLDRLYKTGLQSAGSWGDSLFRTDCCNILGAILCVKTPLSYSAIDSLLALPRPCLWSISRLGCVLRGGETEVVRILHPSFHDYLSKRCSAEPWSINLELHNETLAVHCVEFLDNTLRQNICGLTLPHPVGKETLPEAVSYACKFWVEHVCLISHSADTIGDQIYEFLGRHLLHWMEALAVIKSHNTTIRSLQNLLEWLQKLLPKHTALLQIVYDGHRFAQYFANTIGEHPLLLYMSALPFTPANTSIYERFDHKGLPKVICGVEKLWPRQLQLFQHNHSVNSVTYSPDGSNIVFGSGDKTIRVWDASTGVEVLPPLRGHDGPVHSVALSPDGSKIVSGGDSTIRVWDASTGVEMLPPLQGHNADGRVSSTSVAFSPDGSKIVSGCQDSAIRVWDARIGVEVLPPMRGHDSRVNAVVFSPDGSKIVSGSTDKTIRVWDATTGLEMLPPLRGHDGIVISVSVSSDGSKIVSGSNDKAIRVWDASTGVQMLHPMYAHSYHPVFSVAFSPDGSKIVSGARDKGIAVVDLNTGVRALPHLRGHDGYVMSVAFSPDGSKIVSGSDDKTIRVWDAHAGVEDPEPLQGHYDLINSVDFSPDGSKIVSGGYFTARVWDASTGVQMFPPLRHDHNVLSVAFSLDGSKIASGSDDTTVRVWDANTGTQLFPPFQSNSGSVSCVAFSPDGSKIVSGTRNNTIHVWDVNVGTETLPSLRGHDTSVWLHSVAFSPDGSKIISASDQIIRVRDASTGVEMLPPLRGHDGPVGTVAFSPDGSKIVSGGDNTIRVWDTITGVEVLPPLRGHDGSVTYAAFSLDGSKIMSGSWDNTIRVWDVSTGAEMAPTQITHQADDEISASKRDCPIVSLHQGWFTDLLTGRCLGKLPVGSSYYGWRVWGSYCVGWTAEHELVILRFAVGA
ncbi:hypothetical protein PILCRDRAFT_69471 [Piloderma croceum F 1598]|uniref:Nephrocystin 3-like N-terminal domain-containing protein n=1 Tax=Piloderma croceum (strain F 1598) TaxID=765440 RepID=A0A0C3BA97_PILCF|nr:hypothetical protein PILCRDRAFT_69471 [Piloderma croceum F 1598]